MSKNLDFCRKLTFCPKVTFLRLLTIIKILDQHRPKYIFGIFLLSYTEVSLLLKKLPVEKPASFPITGKNFAFFVKIFFFRIKQLFFLIIEDIYLLVMFSFKRVLQFSSESVREASVSARSSTFSKINSADSPKNSNIFLHPFYRFVHSVHSGTFASGRFSHFLKQKKYKKLVIFNAKISSMF